MSRSRTLRWAPKTVILAGAALSIACGPEFEPVSTIESLRVLAVQKDKPYPAPGDEVNLSMLWHDGRSEPREDPPENVQVAWFGGCYNPPADLWFGCLETLGQSLASFDQGDDLPEDVFGIGSRFKITIPEDIISSREAPVDEDIPPFGTAFVFFAVCAGQIGIAPADQLDEFPLACYDSEGNQLYVDDFVVGYSQLFAYDEFRNQNPIMTGFTFNGVEVTPDCIGDDCVDNDFTPAGECGDPGIACVETCAKDGDEECPGVDIKPIIDRASAEQDEVAEQAEKRSIQESMWINYYYSDGGTKSPIRLLNDATKGWNEDFGTKFYAPKEPGDVKIWAVARDNRGGAEWVRINVKVIP